MQLRDVGFYRLIAEAPRRSAGPFSQLFDFLFDVVQANSTCSICARHSACVWL